jgi:hypothetical protein
MKLYLECMCHTELIQLEYEADDDLLYMSYYTYSRKGNRYGFINRLRHIWKIIREGHPYSDGIILDRAEREKLIKTLNKFKRAHILKKEKRRRL